MLLVVYYSEIRTLRPCVFVPQQVRNQMGSLCQQWRRHAGRHREVAFLGVTIITERKTLNSVIRLRTLFAIQPIFRKFPFLKSAQRFPHLAKICSLAIFIRHLFDVHLKFVWQRDETNLFQLLCTTHIIYIRALSLKRRWEIFLPLDEEKSDCILNRGFNLNHGQAYLL